jgi:hypothetical protein
MRAQSRRTLPRRSRAGLLIAGVLVLKWTAPLFAQGAAGAPPPRLRGGPYPYPGSTFLARDAAYQASVLSERGAGDGSVARVQSFTSKASFPVVKTYLDAQLAQPTTSTLVDRPDGEMADFVRASDSERIAALGPVVLGDRSAEEFRTGFLLGFEEGPGERAEEAAGRAAGQAAAEASRQAFLAVGVHRGPDGASTRVEIQQSYFDLGSFEWVSGTRIRLIRFGADSAGATSK